VTIWIGELQWQLRNGFGIQRSPILGALNGIECRDALLNADGTEAEWPPADAVVGNPPFLGGKKLISGLGVEYVSKLFRLFDERVPAEADLVCYWLYKAGSLVKISQHTRAGLVGTNSVRGGANRKVLQRLSPECVIFDAWDDEPWVVDGAAVRVALVGIAKRDDSVASAIALDGTGPGNPCRSDRSGWPFGRRSHSRPTDCAEQGHRIHGGHEGRLVRCGWCFGPTLSA
jgi:type II restriction/modification system DNA methylase subunit YeeA